MVERDSMRIIVLNVVAQIFKLLSRGALERLLVAYEILYEILGSRETLPMFTYFWSAS